jgi:hypothetical protein
MIYSCLSHHEGNNFLSQHQCPAIGILIFHFFYISSIYFFVVIQAIGFFRELFLGSCTFNYTSWLYKIVVWNHLNIQTPKIKQYLLFDTWWTDTLYIWILAPILFVRSRPESFFFWLWLHNKKWLWLLRTLCNEAFLKGHCLNDRLAELFTRSRKKLLCSSASGT